MKVTFSVNTQSSFGIVAVIVTFSPSLYWSTSKSILVGAKTFNVPLYGVQSSNPKSTPLIWNTPWKYTGIVSELYGIGYQPPTTSLVEFNVCTEMIVLLLSSKILAQNVKFSFQVAFTVLLSKTYRYVGDLITPLLNIT